MSFSEHVKEISLSVVIPMYKEEKRLEEGVRPVLEFMSQKFPDGEVILVDDGSPDQTAQEAESLLKKFPKLHTMLLRLGKNQGKGAAVRAGMSKAQGRARLFTDADNATPIEEVERMLDLLKGDRSIVIGTRGGKNSKVEKRQPWWRKRMGMTFNLLMRFIVGMPFKDTQCGFKLFGQVAAQECFSRQTLERFAFDVELLWISRKLQLEVEELPVRWRHIAESRVHPILDSLQMANDILKIRWRHRNLRA